VLLLLALATLAQITGLLVWVPLSWQRYIVPIVPFLCIWAAYPLGFALEKSSQFKKEPTS
jgi:hypothetical protein